MIRRIDGGVPESFPTQDPDLVRTVVAKAHVDYETVRELVTHRPALARSSWDWGFGDWESALGAASHMGRRDMAELLIAHGARPNLFTLAMLDQVDAVRVVCEANPGIQRNHGPHGITLLGHARNGKADRVTAYLEQLGEADIGQPDLGLDEVGAWVYRGEYQPRDAPGVVFRIGFHDRRNVLTFQRDDRPLRFLLRSGEHVFSPGGVADVRIVFDVTRDRATSLTVHDGDLLITAARIAEGPS
jgi:hypothetical protein